MPTRSGARPGAQAGAAAAPRRSSRRRSSVRSRSASACGPARRICFVLAGRDPATGRASSPSRRTSAPRRCMFDLHNRHTYSDEDIRAGSRLRQVHRGGRRADDEGRSCSIAAPCRANSGRRRISTSGSQAAPAPAASRRSRRSATRTINDHHPAGVNEVSILGEVLDATTAAGHETATPGRTVAIISNVRVEYRPAPAKRRRPSRSDAT